MNVDDTLNIIFQFAIHVYEDFVNLRRVCEQWGRVSRAAHLTNVLSNPLSLGGSDSEVRIRRDLLAAVSMIEKFVCAGVERELQKPRQKRCRVVRLDMSDIGESHAARAVRGILGGMRLRDDRLAEMFLKLSGYDCIDLHRDPGAVILPGKIRCNDEVSVTVRDMVAGFFASLKKRLSECVKDCELKGFGFDDGSGQYFVFRTSGSLGDLDDAFSSHPFHVVGDYLVHAQTERVEMCDGHIGGDGKYNDGFAYARVPVSHFKDSAAVEIMKKYCAPKDRLTVYPAWKYFCHKFGVSLFVNPRP